MSVSLPGYTIPAEQLHRTDPSSYSNHKYAQTTSYHIDIVPDFETQTFKTIFDLEVVIRDAAVVVLSLDQKGQRIDSVVQIDALKGKVINESVVYQAAAETCPLGDRFVLGFPQQALAVGDKLYYRFTYTTSPQASAAQFLPKEQSGTGHYYVYTQCQAIHARSLLIIQDTCASKATYSSAVHVPQPLVAIMSAVPTSPNQRYAEATCVDAATNTATFTFDQKVPIPPYLYALCIGVLEQREISDRCGVIAIPDDVEIAKREYSELEKTLSTIESFAGPYRWTKYYVNSMPLTFPFGGMENPVISYMSKSLLPLQRKHFLMQNSKCYRCQADTESNDHEILGIATSVGIHEQSHSWAGNLTTNESWQEFYLNEGFCVYLEWRTIQKLYGKPYESLHRLIGWEDLKASVDMYTEMGIPQATALITDLSGDVDPDDYFSSVPYMKGSAFMLYLEDIMGGAERFEPFMKFFFDTYAYKTFNSQDFKAFYLAYCKEHGFEERIGEIDWQRWFYGHGMAPVQPAVDMTLANQCYDLVNTLIDPAQPSIPAQLSLKDWKSTQQTVFLDRLTSIFDSQFDPVKGDIAARSKVQEFWRQIVIPAVTKQFNFGPSVNCELLSRWLQLLIKIGTPQDFIVSDDQVTLAESLKLLLAENGRMKFLRPTVRLMLRSSIFRDLCKEYYTELRSRYHIIAATVTDKDVKAADAQEPVY